MRRVLRAGRALGAALLVLGLCVGCVVSGRPAASRAQARHGGGRVTGWRWARPGAAGRVRGRLLRVRIPGRTSGFVPRAAYVYLPPAVTSGKAKNLPVLELLHGTPGSPRDWVTKGGIAGILGRFAATHHGEAPVTVMPDINGSQRGDSECVHAMTGDIEQYLTADVPNWVKSRYPVSENPRRWSIAGISEGGMCSVMLALRHPSQFTTFAELSGLARPTIGRTDDPAATVRELFGGSLTAYDQHDPEWLLQHHTYRGMSGWFGFGTRETTVAADERTVANSAADAQVDVNVVAAPGGHSWRMWSAQVRRLLPWIWARSRM